MSAINNSSSSDPRIMGNQGNYELAEEINELQKRLKENWEYHDTNIRFSIQDNDDEGQIESVQQEKRDYYENSIEPLEQRIKKLEEELQKQMSSVPSTSQMSSTLTEYRQT